MSRPRLLGWQDENCYHIVSRTTGQDLLFGPAEREQFALMMTKVAQFCAVEMLTWCCLSNHFHLLVRIPRNDQLKLQLRSDRSAFLTHLTILYSPAEVRTIAAELEQLEQSAASDQQQQAQRLVESYLSRIGDLSNFVKELKQRFSIYYNDRHKRHGTLWSERFRSVLVENSAATLRTVATYIDLNPIRAGLVEDPADYRWCGYAQALSGHRQAKAGIRAIVAVPHRGCDGPGAKENSTGNVTTAKRRPQPLSSWQDVAANYRLALFGHAAQSEHADGKVLRKGTSQEALLEVIEAGGKLPAWQLFRLRVRYLTEGVALGSADFLRGTVDHQAQRLGANQKTVGHPCRGLDSTSVHSLRDLQRKVFSATAQSNSQDP